MKYLNSIFRKHPEPISSESLQKIYRKHVSPEVAKISLEWDESNQWIGSSQNGIRKVLKHQVNKGLKGTFIWGLCFDFLPVISRKRIVLQRTFKSARPQLFESSATSDNLNNGKSNLENGITTTWGEKECRKSISKLLEKRREEIFCWLENGQTLEGSIAIAETQIKDKTYSTHWPNPKYVAAFLYARNGDKNKGMQMLEEIDNERLNLQSELFGKLKERLLEL